MIQKTSKHRISSLFNNETVFVAALIILNIGSIITAPRAVVTMSNMSDMGMAGHLLCGHVSKLEIVFFI